MRVLIVDDDPELAELVSTALVREGYFTATANSLAKARAEPLADWDIVILDLGLPDGSGISLCRELRESGQELPVLLLTAQSAVEHRVAGLNSGADDYLVKPFALAELRARVRALGRRRKNPPTVFHRKGNVELDLAARIARQGKQIVPMTPRQWSILECLAVARGRVVSRDRLLEEVWGNPTDGAAASLEVLIGRIRGKLGREIIRTVRMEGYALD